MLIRQIEYIEAYSFSFWSFTDYRNAQSWSDLRLILVVLTILVDIERPQTFADIKKQNIDFFKIDWDEKYGSLCIQRQTHMFFDYMAEIHPHILWYEDWGKPCVRCLYLLETSRGMKRNFCKMINKTYKINKLLNLVATFDQMIQWQKEALNSNCFEGHGSESWIELNFEWM